MEAKGGKGIPLPKVKKMGVELKFSADRLIGLTFIAKDEEGKRILEDLRNGNIRGLECYQDKTVRPLPSKKNGTYIIGLLTE